VLHKYLALQVHDPQSRGASKILPSSYPSVLVLVPVLTPGTACEPESRCSWAPGTMHVWCFHRSMRRSGQTRHQPNLNGCDSERKNISHSFMSLVAALISDLCLYGRTRKFAGTKTRKHACMALAVALMMTCLTKHTRPEQDAEPGEKLAAKIS
jgi:hypothetical protein